MKFTNAAGGVNKNNLARYIKDTYNMYRASNYTWTVAISPSTRNNEMIIMIAFLAILTIEDTTNEIWHQAEDLIDKTLNDTRLGFTENEKSIFIRMFRDLTQEYKEAMPSYRDPVLKYNVISNITTTMLMIGDYQVNRMKLWFDKILPDTIIKESWKSIFNDCWNVMNYFLLQVVPTNVTQVLQTLGTYSRIHGRDAIYALDKVDVFIRPNRGASLVLYQDHPKVKDMVAILMTTIDKYGKYFDSTLIDDLTQEKYYHSCKV